MPLHRLIPAFLLCVVAFAAGAQEALPQTTVPDAESSMNDEASSPPEPEAQASTPEPVTEPPVSDAQEAPEPEADTPRGVLEMPQEIAPAEQPIPIRMPVKGMTMNEVEDAYGAPLTKMAAVGQPPITRWVYADYIVYFEYSEVIHSVINERNSD